MAGDKEESCRAQRAARARALADKLAETLRTELGAARVWLIGSLARGEFGLESDIDLVAQGIAPESFFRASARVQEIAGDIAVDLAPREALRPRTERALAVEGILL